MFEKSEKVSNGQVDEIWVAPIFRNESKLLMVPSERRKEILLNTLIKQSSELYFVEKTEPILKKARRMLRCH